LRLSRVISASVDTVGGAVAVAIELRLAATTDARLAFSEIAGTTIRVIRCAVCVRINSALRARFVASDSGIATPTIDLDGGWGSVATLGPP
jgi:hypothetical protein